MDKTLLDAIAVANSYGLTDRAIANAVEVVTAARRAQAEQAGLVPMVHPKLSGEIRVDPEAVPVHEASGWTVRAEEPPGGDGPAAPTRAELDAGTDLSPKSAKAAKAAPKKET